MSRFHVDASSLIHTLGFITIAALIISFGTFAGGFAPLTIAAIVGVIGGAAVAAARSSRGLGASLTSERPSSHPGTINLSHIPVSGVGGLGILAAAIGLGLMLPDGRQLIGWALVGAFAGSGGFLAWRHFHGGSPYAEHPEETLHLR